MNKLLFLLIAISISGVLVGCGVSRGNTPAYSYETAAAKHEFTRSQGDYAGVAEDKAPGPTDKKILFSATLSLLVNKPDSAAARIGNVATRYKGYIQETGTYRSTIRVPAASLNMALADLSDLGKVRSKSVGGQDVTTEYLDYQIRLDNAQKSRERYLELLAKAENVEAALKVEKELERLNETIELLKGQTSRIDHLSEYATITIYLKEKKKPGVLGYVGIGLYRSVKWLFVRN